jgi:serine/threonine-protein kinase
VKVLHAELARIKDVRTRFLREGYAANKVGHPGVVRVHDDEDGLDGTAFLVMDLLEGKTLERHRLDCGGRLPIKEAVQLVCDLLEIVTAAHENRIVHRDIKPDNVFLTASGETRLMDFGIARVLDAARVTNSGAVMGTPAFMSPEQAAARNKVIDAPSDVWSIGAVLFLLLTGEEVHRARTTAEQMIFAATQPARSIHTLMPNLDTDLMHVLDIALAFEIEDRWQSAGAMCNALRQVANACGFRPARPPPSAAAAASIVVNSSPTLIHGSTDANAVPPPRDPKA